MGLLEKSRAAYKAIQMKFLLALAMVNGVIDFAWQVAPEWRDAFLDMFLTPRMKERATSGQSGAVLTVVVVGIIIIIGILVYSEIESALPTPSNNDLSNASSNATGTFGDAMELAPVILIVLIASVVLAVVQRFR